MLATFRNTVVNISTPVISGRFQSLMLFELSSMPPKLMNFCTLKHCYSFSERSREIYFQLAFLTSSLWSVMNSNWDQPNFHSCENHNFLLIIQNKNFIPFYFIDIHSWDHCYISFVIKLLMWKTYIFHSILSLKYLLEFLNCPSMLSEYIYFIKMNVCTFVAMVADRSSCSDTTLMRCCVYANICELVLGAQKNLVRLFLDY